MPAQTRRVGGLEKQQHWGLPSPPSPNWSCWFGWGPICQPIDEWGHIPCNCRFGPGASFALFSCCGASHSKGCSRVCHSRLVNNTSSYARGTPPCNENIHQSSTANRVCIATSEKTTFSP